jgi:predicted dehydrogenase
MSELPRRTFIRNAAATAAALTLLPSGSYGKQRRISANDKVNVATVGCGGMGRANLVALANMNLVAMCDVDWNYVDSRFADIANQIANANKRATEATDPVQKDKALQQVRDWQALQAQIPKSTRYTDYREMLAKQKNIDAVVVATPDHTHALIALAAMDLGKHVYVQKPLAWSVEECRRLSAKATSSKLQTQMGNQGHSSDDARLVNEYIQSGAIGTVTEVHVWTNRPLAYWPQGIPRPAPLPPDAAKLPWNMNGVMTRAAGAMGSYPVPDKLAWDLFLGPSRWVDYHPVYHPFNWRGWTDWGVGAIGDMGAHLIDSSFWALDLDYPDALQPRHLSDVVHDVLPVPGQRLAPRGEDDLVRRRADAAEAGRARRGGAQQGWRRAVHRHEGQAAARHLWLQPAPAAEVAAREHGQAAGNVRAHQDQPRDELDRRDPRHAEDHEPVRILGQAHGDHAARRGRVERRQESSIRRRQHARDERAGLGCIAQAQVPRRMGADLSPDRATGR